MNCPKCGFQQENRADCLRCGIVFERYSAAQPRPAPKHSVDSPFRAPVSPLRRFFRIFRWVSLTILIVAILLILRTSDPPNIAIPPDAAQLAEEKVQQFQSSIQNGTRDTLELTQAELNAWLDTNLALKRDTSAVVAPPRDQSIDSLAKIATGGKLLDEQSVQQMKSSVREVKIELLEDRLRAYTVFDLHGKDLSLELEGRLYSEDGYIRLEPTAGKLGSLPLMSTTLHTVADRLFNSPENREQFKLPAEIREIAIKDGNLVVTSR